MNRLNDSNHAIGLEWCDLTRCIELNFLRCFE